ncbi:helix-turn-helix transcriptional regulator [Flavobacterium sp. S87F.05.LMB.W.Kidney.N]|uniref:helix-turn-helix transcriptional regulator n=1 Tax=Flavobacterium sp. S87F.05.LMB.W.Kidney.N TaxID=1278758 RepID=UPI0010EA31E7|nr:helix-turn-helix transcriptional regulator [Flavobacterium sp. S87F.05.LMB.W.Kidney.N]TDX09643.1 DNA-binding XRE family transcriptional regulator [Flavobacterium sp. S87F.05.LMB.W.Kidney.N]
MKKTVQHPRYMGTSIKNKIKNIRELRNYTQQYMADQLGITQAGYSKIEKGKTLVSYSKLLEISVIFEASIEEIINFDSQGCIKSLNTIKDTNTDLNDNYKVLKELYEDKIKLLEKLLNKTENELEYYKTRFGL